MPNEDASGPHRPHPSKKRSPLRAPTTLRSALRPMILRVLKLALSNRWMRAAGRRALALSPRLDRRLRGIAGRAGLIAATERAALTPADLTPRAARIYRHIRAAERHGR